MKHVNKHIKQNSRISEPHCGNQHNYTMWREFHFVGPRKENAYNYEDVNDLITDNQIDKLIKVNIPPDAWDDYPRHYQKNWKKQRKNQYK